MKFKLVKSNSCSSRLELAGTGKTPPDLRKRILSRNSDYSSPPLLERDFTLSPEKECDEAEESVRTMITRLENGTSKQLTRATPPAATGNIITAAPITKPRIIESKCIEKQIQIENTTNTKTNNINNNHNHNELVTINNQTINDLSVNRNEQQHLLATTATAAAAITQEQNQQTSHTQQQQTVLNEEMPITTTATVAGHVTVNNHISYSKPAITQNEINNNNNNNTNNSSNNVNKVCRNKNVDLAFATVNGNKINSTKPNKDKETNSSKKGGKENVNSADPATHPTPLAASVPATAATTTPATATATITFNDLKTTQILTNDANDNSKTVHDNLMSDLIRINEIESKNQLESPKLVNWSITGAIPNKFDEKQYIANDHKLKEKKKYDEMEFEEFEVFDPNKSECYDSLNSNK